MKTLTINTKHVSNDYPYGRLECTATFSIEFNPKKGFRSVFQTINPKTGRLNAPKFDTYAPILVMEIEDGFISFNKIDFRGNVNLNKAFKFVDENFDLFTKEQIQFLCDEFVLQTKIEFKAIILYCGAKVDDIKDFYIPIVNTLYEIKSTGTNLFKTLEIDIEGIESRKPANFNPFNLSEFRTQ